VPRRSSLDSPDVATTDFVLNIAPIQFEDAPLSVGVLEYKNHQHLTSLRVEHRLTHVFHHDGSEQILCVPIVPEAPTLGARSEEIRLHDNLHLCATLISNALLSYFCRKGRQSLGYDPIEIVGNESNESLLAATAPFGCPSWLAIRPLYDLAVRVLHFDQQSPVALLPKKRSKKCCSAGSPVATVGCMVWGANSTNSIPAI